MKKYLLTLLSFFTIQTIVLATNTVEVKPLSISKGGTAKLEIQLENSDEIKAFQFNLVLPDGITVTNVEKSERLPDGIILDYNALSTPNTYRIIGYQIGNTPFSGTSGCFVYVTLSASDALTVGSNLTGHISEISLTVIPTAEYEAEGSYFEITIVEPADPWVTLDENSTTLPEASDGETAIKVKRTIKANQWNTICFPFAMTKAQVYEAFGEDVQVANFESYKVLDDLTGINVVFGDAGLDKLGLEANYPYIIKTSKDLTEFIVTSRIEPNEDNAYTEYAEGRGPNREVYGTFYGTLKAGGKVPANCLFLNGGDFWYSTGKSNIKAFRGYFAFVDVLASLETAASKVKMVFRDETTGIKNVIVETANDDMYDLQGRRIVNPNKGVYIKNGKKVVVK
ncbi:MAG: hypothetical protein SPH23_06990 [Prevotella sp.]|nr:hypothetical protein [Prevotellaceae bacterium]MDY5250588.1 hypothetical protein [Prevotella sp.]